MIFAGHTSRCLCANKTDGVEHDAANLQEAERKEAKSLENNVVHVKVTKLLYRYRKLIGRFP